VTFGGSYSYCWQCRHADILSLSPPSPLLSEIPFYCPPLPEFPFVSKTNYLSIGYFLSDSEALALPKCRAFIYAMDNSECEVIETSKISNFDAFLCFAKGLMWLEQQTDSEFTEFMLLKQLRDRATERRQSFLQQRKLPFKPM
ncbi:hypothetical protein AVEN_98471-1, partial [Araneus ventricosus]